jgi:hypothetical protein
MYRIRIEKEEERKKQNRAYDIAAVRRSFPQGSVPHADTVANSLSLRPGPQQKRTHKTLKSLLGSARNITSFCHLTDEGVENNIIDISRLSGPARRK